METKKCIGKHNTSVKSPHPRNYVPIHLFVKDPMNHTGETYQTCLHCREYNSKLGREIRERYNKKVHDNNPDNQFCFCPSNTHSTYSKYDRDKVPTEFFRNEEGNPRSLLSRFCRDCLHGCKEYKKKYQLDKMSNAESKNLFYCQSCCKEVPPDQRGKNVDGSPSAICIVCKGKQNQLSVLENKQRAQAYHNIVMGFIQTHQCSCYKCKSIYIKPLSGTMVVRELNTILKDDGKRYLNYDNHEYSVDIFIKTYEHLLELAIIDLDHLTEQEQRDRGLLKPGEPFIPKKNTVRLLGSEQAMKSESRKCQHLCARCHVEVTMGREKSNTQYIGSGITAIKLNYVNGIKKTGCVSCGYKNVNLLRFFDMDHIDPKIKSGHVSCMARDYKCNVDTFIAECNKCRVLCRYCHRIHTRNQKLLTYSDSDTED